MTASPATALHADYSKEVISSPIFIATSERKRLAGGNKVTTRAWSDFRCREYSDGKVVADKETRERIVKMGIRKMARLTGIHSGTITLIASGKPVKPNTLARVIGFL